MANLGSIIKTSAKGILTFGKLYAPEIATGTGLVSMVAGTVAAVKAQPKVQQIKEQYKDDKRGRYVHTAIAYIPTALFEIGGGGLIIGGMYLKNKQVVALGTSLAIAAEAAKTYQSEIKALVPEEKAKEIEEKVTETMTKKREEITGANTNDTPSIIPPSNQVGLFLCQEGLTGQIFWANKDRIQRVYDWITKQLAVETYCSVNDYLCEFELTEVSDGNGRGWCSYAPKHTEVVRYLGKWEDCTVEPYIGQPIYVFRPTVDPYDI